MGGMKNFLFAGRAFLTSHRCVLYLIVFAAFLRLDHCLDNRALWLDEAWRAVEIVGQSFGDILLGRKVVVPSPVGFQVLTKLSVVVFGMSEYAFRLVPLIAGILSPVLLFLYLRRAGSRESVPVCLAFFAFCPALVYFSAENKQFSTDVFVALLLYVIADKLTRETLSAGQVGKLSLVAALCVWVSWPALFICVAMALMHVVLVLLKKVKQRVLLLGVFHAAWLVSFLAVYWLSLQKRAGIKGLVGMWEGAFWPLPPWSQESLSWLGQKIWTLMQYPVGLAYPALGIAAMCLGCYVILRNRRDRGFLLLLPMALALLASAGKLYPFSDRAVLFLLPAVFVVMSEGVAWLFRKGAFLRLLGIVLFVLMLFHPVQQSVRDVFHLRRPEEVRPLMRYLKSRQRPGDCIYLTTSSLYAYNHYHDVFRFPFSITIKGLLSDILREDQGGTYLFVYHPVRKFDSKIYLGRQLLPGKVNPQNHNITQLDGCARTWVFFSHFDPKVEQHILSYLDRMGRRVQVLRETGAALYLYDLRQGARVQEGAM